MKKKFALYISALSIAAFTACIDTYIENPEDEEKSDDTTVINSGDLSNSSIEALNENCATHEKSGDYVWGNSSVVTIVLNGQTATITGSGATATGNKVTITNAGNYSISGSLSDGQVIVNTEDTATVRLILNNAEISSSSSVPINVVKAKKTILVLTENSTNLIEDKLSSEGTDSLLTYAAIFSEDNLTICGSGKLSAISDNNAGIVSKGGLIIANSTINVTSKGVGICGKDYIEVKSGSITIDSDGDGMKSNNSDDNTKGYIAILSGTINITSAGDAIIAQTDAIVADGNITITSGDNNSSTSTSGNSRGIKGSVNVIIEKGTINLNCADKAIVSKGNVAVNGGTITVKTTVAGANGLDSDSILSVSGGSVDISVAGDQSKAIKSSGTMTLNGGNITIATTGGVLLEASGSGYLPSYCIGIKGGSNVVQSGSTITINSSGIAGKGVSTDGNFTMKSGSLDIKTSGSGATYKNASGTTDAYSSSCISTDGATNLIGGTVTLSSTGSAGKGILSTGALTIGDETNSPILTVTTSGSKITVSGSSSSGNGGFGGGGPGGGPGGNSSNADYSSAKAVKSDEAIVINNGTVTISSADDGIKSEKSITINNGSVSITKSTEGMESPVITVNNGNVSITASDDGFNATAGLTAGGTEQNDGSTLTVNGGTVSVSTTTGDAIDSNGNFTLTGGIIIAQGPSSSPELGMDVNGSSIISGGTLIASGPNSGNMIEGPSTSSSQYSVMVTSSSIGTNLFHVQDESGNEIITFKPTRSAYYVTFSSPKLIKGSSYTIFTGGSSTGTNINGYYSGGTYTAGTSKKTFSVSNKLTTVSF